MKKLLRNKVSWVYVLLPLLLLIPLSVTWSQLQTFRYIINDVWDKANNRLMTTAGVGAQGVFETETTIFNNVWDSSNHYLRTSGGGGGSSLTVKDIDGTPTVTDVSTVRFTNGTVTDDGSGQVTVVTSTSPAGSSGDIQYNNSGAFGGRTLIPRANGGQCDVYLAPGTNTLHTAIAAMTTGQVLCLGVGTYTQTGANILAIGDGSNSQVSSIGSITILGVSAPIGGYLRTDYGYTGKTLIDCTGTTSGHCFEIRGPIEAVTITDVTLLGSGSVANSTGLRVISGVNGRYQRLSIQGFNIGARFTTLDSPSFGGVYDSIHNLFADSTIKNASSSNTGLILMGENINANTDFNIFSNLTIGHAGTTGSQCIYMAWTDNNHLIDVHCTNWTTGGLSLDYSTLGGLRGPFNNDFYGLELGTGTVVITGTAETAYPNYAYGWSLANGGVCPVDKLGLLVYGCAKDSVQEVHGRSITAPATPSAGYGVWWSDTGGKVFSYRSDAGGISHTVQTLDCTTAGAGFVQKINGDGTATCGSTFGGIPTIGSCGTSPAIGTGSTAQAGFMTIGTGGVATSCAMTFAVAWASIPSCMCNHPGAILYTRAVATTTTLTCDAATPLTAGGRMEYICGGVR